MYGFASDRLACAIFKHNKLFFCKRISEARLKSKQASEYFTSYQPGSRARLGSIVAPTEDQAFFAVLVFGSHVNARPSWIDCRPSKHDKLE